MNTKSDIANRDGALELASMWISRIDRGLDAEEEKLLAEWLKESESHMEALFNLATLWDNLSSLNKFK